MLQNPRVDHGRLDASIAPERADDAQPVVERYEFGEGREIDPHAASLSRSPGQAAASGAPVVL
ncbi:hypothetical protein GCM10009735_49780 [Actinomadura chokoriensis]